MPLEILKRQQSKPDVSQKLREQIINIVTDLVDDIAPGFLVPNPFFPLDYQERIYEQIYKSLWDEFGKQRFESAFYHHEIFEFLRNVTSNDFFYAVEHLLKVVSGIVYLQGTIPDNIISPGGEPPWTRPESVRNKHINLFNDAAAKLNYRLSQNNAKYRYESGKMVRVNGGPELPEEDNHIQEPDDNHTQEHQQNKNRSEFWNRKIYIITLVGVIIVFLDFAFDSGMLIRLFHWVWNYL